MILIGAYVFSALLGIIFTFSGAIEHVNLLWVLVYQAVLVAVYALASIKYLPLSFDEEQNRKMRAEYKRQENEEKETNQDKETEDQ